MVMADDQSATTPPDAELLLLKQEAKAAGACSIDGELGYTVGEARKAMPHVGNVMKRILEGKTARRSGSPTR